MMEENPKWPWKSGNICSNYLRFLAKVTFPTIQLATITKLSYFTILSNIYYQCRDGANAIPGYKNYTHELFTLGIIAEVNSAEVQ